MTVRALLVDDSELFIRELSRSIDDVGCLEVVGTAAHGLQALDLLDTLRPDVVALDLRMPVMDGLETLKHIMTRCPRPVVVVSALDDGDGYLTFESLRHGAVDFVSKPHAGEREAALHAVACSLRQAAQVDPATLTLTRLMRREMGRPIASPGGESANDVVVVSAGRSGLLPTLQFLNGLEPASSIACVLSLDVAPRVARSFAAHAQRFCALRVDAPECGSELLAGSVHVLSSRESYLVVRDEAALWLRSFVPPGLASTELLVESLFRSVGEEMGTRGHGLLLAGCSLGARAGAQRLREFGGRLFLEGVGGSVRDRGLQALRADPFVTGLENIALLPAELAAEPRPAMG